MTLNQLKVFEAVASCLSITRASQALGISEPSTFQQVKLLEEQIGAKLYRKTGRTIELTPEGKEIRSDIRNLLSIVIKLQCRFQQNPPSAGRRKLIIGGSHALSTTFLPALIAAFKKQHPSVELILRTKGSKIIEKLMLDSDVEVALITGLPSSPLLQAIPYRAEDFVAFISAKNSLARKNQLSLAELAHCPLILKKQRSKGGDYLRRMEALGFQPRILMECDSAEAIKTAVMKGLGLGFLYRDHLKSEIKRGELKVVRILGLQKPAATSYVLYRKDRALSAEARDFMDLLQRVKSKPLLKLGNQSSRTISSAKRFSGKISSVL